MIVKTNISK